MNRLSLILSVPLLILIGTGCNDTASSFDKADPFQQQVFRFVVAADPQLFRGKKEDLDNAIESINTLEPAFVVMCGDLIETPANQEQIRAYKDSVANLDPTISLYNVPGNHDLGQPVRIENISSFQENFGQLWFSFTCGNSLFIALSSDLLRDRDAPMNPQQTEWLINILDEEQSRTADHIFVFMHHPLYLDSPDEPDGYSNLPDKIRRRLLNLFVKHRVRAVFSGHLHHNKRNHYHGVDLITTNSITVPMGKDAPGFRIVDVYPDQYEERHYGIKQHETPDNGKSILPAGNSMIMNQ